MSDADADLAAWTALLAQLEERAACLLRAADSDDALTGALEVPELVVPPQCGALPAALAAEAEAVLDRLRSAESALQGATRAVGRELALLARVGGDRTSTPLYVDFGM